MGKVDALRVPSLDLWFNSADHRPPHFHAEKADHWEVRVYFLRAVAHMVEAKWGRPRKSELKELLALAEEHRALLLEEWGRKVVVADNGPEG